MQIFIKNIVGIYFEIWTTNDLRKLVPASNEPTFLNKLPKRLS